MRVRSHVFFISIVLNSFQALFKFYGFTATRSIAVYAEMLHSASDTVNSSILFLGALMSNRRPSPKYPFGFARFPLIASTISISILVGAIANNVLLQALTALGEEPTPLGDLFAGSLALYAAIGIDAAILASVITIRGSKGSSLSRIKPLTTALIIEDLLSLSGNAIALTALHFSETMPHVDAVASIAIAGIIVAASGYVVYKNIEILIGRSAPKEIMLRVLEKVSRIKDVIDIDDLKSYAMTPEHYIILISVGVDPKRSAEEMDALKNRIVNEVLSIDPRIRSVVVEFSSEPIDDRDRFELYRQFSSMD